MENGSTNGGDCIGQREESLVEERESRTGTSHPSGLLLKRTPEVLRSSSVHYG